MNMRDGALRLPERACRQLLPYTINSADEKQGTNCWSNEIPRELDRRPRARILPGDIEVRRGGGILVRLLRPDGTHCSDLTTITRRTGCGMLAGAGLLIVSPRNVAVTAASRSRSPVERN